MKRVLALSIITLATFKSSLAEASVFQAGLWGPFLQIIDDQKSIAGVRLNVAYSVNENVSGLDIGIAQRTRQEGRGIQLNIHNETWGSNSGLQLGFVSIANGGASGGQFGLGYSRAGDYLRGLQLGVVSHVGRYVRLESNGDMTGVQLGVVSQVFQNSTGLQSGLIYGRTYGELTGAQLGIANHSGSVTGVQIGLINIADAMNGLQIGLWNQINEKEHLKVFPIVNWSF